MIESTTDASIVFRRSYAIISVEASVNAIYIAWLGDISHREYRTVWESAYAASLENSFSTIISDTTHCGLLSLESESWAVNNLAPKLQGKILNICVVVSSDNERLGITNRIRRQTETIFNLCYFDTRDEALEWAINLNNY